MPTDAELFEAWRGGDDRAGNDLFERHFEALFRFFRNKLDDGAEDLVQQTFLACVRNTEGYRGDASFRSYLFTIARTKLLDFLRVRRRKQEPLDFEHTTLADLGISPASWAAQREEGKLLIAALRHLPVDLQIAIELFHLEDMPASEVARVLGVPEGTVRSRVRRGLEQLREEIRRIAGAPRDVERTLSIVADLADKLR
jgi:RNA polymerase sigma-70 factor (ECF subfamily)